MVDAFTAGVLGGLAATTVMTLFQLPISKGSAGSTGILASKLTPQDDPEAPLNKTLGYILHFAYGTFWGVAFALGIDAWIGLDAVGLGTLFGWALALGFGLWAISQAVVTPLTGATEKSVHAPFKETAKYGAVFLVLHLLYGAALATTLWWIPTESTLPTIGAEVPTAGVLAFVAAVVLGAAWQYAQHRRAHN